MLRPCLVPLVLHPITFGNERLLAAPSRLQKNDGHSTDGGARHFFAIEAGMRRPQGRGQLQMRLLLSSLQDPAGQTKGYIYFPSPD